MKVTFGCNVGDMASKMYPVKWTHELATNPHCGHLKR